MNQKSKFNEAEKRAAQQRARTLLRSRVRSLGEVVSISRELIEACIDAGLDERDDRILPFIGIESQFDQLEETESMEMDPEMEAKFFIAFEEARTALGKYLVDDAPDPARQSP